MVSLPPERIKHLEFIQATITRQASHSFTIKGWSLTLSAAIYAFTGSHLHWWNALIGLMPAATFAWLDAFYLRQERLFRELYTATIDPDTTVPMFSMNTFPYTDAVAYPKCSWPCVLKASTWWTFYGVIVGFGLLLIVVSLF
ncbi:hypothetical protein [Streptomyces sp. MUSC 125]|uniref:hypothetical protein n=1 Tax=Streptomyces sp. MUSC 125 TaxID=1428624 RepID=UPI00131B3B23|nr:hypothetical protein [Streptomyces sp. MUSC 125]